MQKQKKHEKREAWRKCVTYESGASKWWSIKSIPNLNSHFTFPFSIPFFHSHYYWSFIQFYMSSVSSLASWLHRTSSWKSWNVERWSRNLELEGNDRDFYYFDLRFDIRVGPGPLKKRSIFLSNILGLNPHPKILF